MQDTRRKIGPKMHGKKLMINWELKKVLPYVMKRYCLILCYLYSMKNKNTKSSLLLILHLALLFLSFLYLCSEFGVPVKSFLSVNTSHKIGQLI